MSRDVSFRQWAEKHAPPQLPECIFCGYPTKHPSRTCPAHRDLAPPIVGLDVPYIDEPAEAEVRSQPNAGRP